MEFLKTWKILIKKDNPFKEVYNRKLITKKNYMV